MTDSQNVEKVEHVTPDVVEGTIYFASNEAIRTRHLREGQRIKVATAGRKVHWLSETFVQIELSSSGRNYVHLDTRPASSIPPEEQS